MKVVLNDVGGNSYSLELSGEDSRLLFGKRIGDKVRGEVLGLQGFEFVITGGSDKDGFPMLRSFSGIGRKRVLLRRGFGLKSYKRKKANKGLRVRRIVRGNTVSGDIHQLNLKLVKEGGKKLSEFFKKEGAEPSGN